MSNKITALCRPLQLSSTQKAVLMCLADYAHDDGRDWHSVAAIMEWTCLSRTPVLRALRDLEQAGLLTIERRNGTRSVTTIALDKLKDRYSTDTGEQAKPVPQENRYRRNTGTPGAPHRYSWSTPTGTPGAQTGTPGAPEALRSISEASEASGLHADARGPGDLFGDSAVAEPEGRPNSRKPSKAKTEGRGVATRDAYIEAFKARYGVMPVIAAKENALFAKVVDSVGIEEAPKLAAYFVSQQNQTAYHAQRTHPPELLVRDLSALRAQMLTGKPVHFNGKPARPSFTTKDYHQGVPK
ncbi:helix-turn-helix domain-containing protein [Aquabacterium sp.]|uniref:helix-turn-helix domain-containing protein n=1 Tax=Aquabacterium sp. TaxID=1872578 RepID=UPI003784EFA7